MKIKLFGALAAIAALTACQTTSGSGMTIADYCADTANSGQHVCELNAELETQSSTLSTTQTSLNSTAQDADAAQATADEAQRMAEEARSMAQSAMLSDNLSCKTLTIQKAQTGQCEAGYTLMSCSQSRYTFAAGGLSILRDINDKECRFNTRVLEMKVRCCRMADSVVQTAENATTISY